MGSDPNRLVLELTRAKEMFMAFLAQPSSGQPLTPEILSSLDKSICMAESRVYLDGNRRPSCPDNSMEPRLITKKRKTIAKSSSLEKIEVKIGTGDGASGPIDDGFTWRKYGQKNIQYTKYPRGYYRCSHRDTRGCPAIKQMQLSSDNPAILEVTYLGSHTCRQSPQMESDEPELKKNRLDHHAQQQYQEPGSLSSSQTGLTVKTEVSGTELASPSFSFPNTPVSCLDLPSFNNCYTDLSAFENGFSASPCRSSSYGEGPSLQIEEESNIQATKAAANSEFMGMEGMDMDLLLSLRDFDDHSFAFI